MNKVQYNLCLAEQFMLVKWHKTIYSKHVSREISKADIVDKIVYHFHQLYAMNLIQ